MWVKETPFLSLLVGLQTGAATTEITVKKSQRAKRRYIVRHIQREKQVSNDQCSTNWSQCHYNKL